MTRSKVVVLLQKPDYSHNPVFLLEAAAVEKRERICSGSA
jgi:hypothetical protein